MSLDDYYRTAPLAKPEPRKKSKARQKRHKLANTHAVHDYVFGREREICRICRWRSAGSMHELRFRSLGGKVSRKNSVAACGTGVTGCHGLAQKNEIAYKETELGAEGVLWFQAKTKAAADWLKVKVGQWIESPPMIQMEQE